MCIRVCTRRTQAQAHCIYLSALDAVVVLHGGEYSRLLDELALLLGTGALCELLDGHALLHRPRVRRRARARARPRARRRLATLADPDALHRVESDLYSDVKEVYSVQV